MITKSTSLSTEALGELTVWQICSPTQDDYLVASSVQKDAGIIVDLRASDIRNITSRLDSLKKLALSVRAVPSKSVKPDYFRVNVKQSDRAITKELLRYTPRGASKPEVSGFLENHLLKDVIYPPNEGGLIIHRDRELAVQIGQVYDGHSTVRLSGGGQSMAFPRTIGVQVWWHFSRDQKLHKIEVRRIPYS